MFTGTFIGDELENSRSGWDAYEDGAEAVAFRRIYAEMAGTALAGLLLSQIIYWHKRSRETGKIRLQVFRDGHYWLAKSFPAWWDECRATPNEARGAIKILSHSRKLKHGVLAGVERLPLIEAAKWKFGSQGNAAPTTHVRIVWENFLPLFELTKQKLEEASRSVKSTDRIGEIHRSNGEIHRSLTETTTEITSEITSEDDDDSFSSSSANGNLRQAISEATSQAKTHKGVLKATEAREAEGWVTPEHIALWTESFWPKQRPSNASHEAPWPIQLKDGVIRDKTKLLEDAGFWQQNDPEHPVPRGSRPG